MNNNNPYSVPSLKMTQVEDPIDPGFTYPDTDVVIPSPDDEIDPDFPSCHPTTRTTRYVRTILYALIILYGPIIPSPACSATITSGFAAEYAC